MNGIPKTRLSGLIVIIVLFVILIIGLYTVVSRYSNEKKLIKRGFVTLQRNSAAIKGKMRIFSIKNYNSLKGSIKTDSSDLANKKDSLKRNLFVTRSREEIEREIRIDSMVLQHKQAHFDSLKSISYTDGGMEVKLYAKSPYQKSQQEFIVNDTLTIKKSFFSDILDKDFFDDYIIFDPSHIYYKSFDVEIDQRNFLWVLKKNIYIPATYKIFTGKKDSSIMHSSWNSGFISKTIINYKPYFHFIYPIKINNRIWYISGLLTNQHYLDKKRHIETWILIFVGILLIFTLFGFQFLKLFLLSKTERINTSDLVLVGFSIAGIASIVTLLFLNINAVFNIRYNCEKQLIQLNTTIKDNFITELNLMYNLVESYEKSDKDNKEEYLLTNVNWNPGDSVLRKAVYNYPCFSNLFCSDFGMADSILATMQKATTPRISYRQYYQKKDEWVLPGSSPEKRFRIESIYSNLTGDVEVVLAKPANNGSREIYAIATSMYSVMNTILLPGYEFRIIGNDGNVWFHNNKKKNNRENFLDECDSKNEVLESMHNRVSSYIPLKISLKNYRSYISPIGTLPLYLVTLCDTKKQNSFLSHINYILMIFIVSGLFLALLGTCLFYYEKLNLYGSHAKIQEYETGLIWLMPDLKKNTKYLTISGLNLLIGVFISLSFLSRGITVIQILLIMLSAYSVCFICFYYLLKPHVKGAFHFSVIALIGILFIFSNIVYCVSMRNPYWFLILESLAVLLIFNILFRSRKTDFSKTTGLLKKLSDDPFIPYTLFISTWIVISCVIPSILLFTTAGKEETELLTKESQIDIATRIEKKNLDIDSTFVKYIKKEKKKDLNLISTGVTKFNLDSIKSSLRGRGNYLLGGFCVETIPVTDSLFDPDISPRDPFISLNRYLRQMFRKEDVRSYQMLYNIGLEKTWFWKGGFLGSSKSDNLDFYYKSNQKNAEGLYNSGEILISSFLPEQKRFYRTYKIGIITFHALTFLAVILFLYLIIYQIVKHVFVLKDNYVINKIDVSALTQDGLVYAISSLGQDQIRNSLLKTHKPVTLDNSYAIGSLDSILLYFNPNPEKIPEWFPVFKSLEKRIESNPANIILISCYSPQQIITMIEEMIQIGTPESKEALKDFRKRLIKIFSNFKVYFIESDKFTKDESDNVYQYIWEKCTLNEKFILSDLSLDAVANAKNEDDIKNLIGKGILEVDGKLKFVNRGFERFIRELAGTEEYRILDRNSKRSDGWNRVKLPIYVIFGAVVLFFFFTQQEIISTISAAILSLTGLIGSLLKFGSSPRSLESQK